MNRNYLGATLVGFYGEKPGNLRGWLVALQAQLLKRVPAFVPRSLEQIHATVIGLEFPLRPVTAADVLGLARGVTRSFQPHIDLQFGGYSLGSSSLTSRGLDLYERSFGLRGGKAIVIGWPSPPTQILASIRQGAEAFGFRHRYHGPDDALDPDCYMVVGEYPAQWQPSIEDDVRAYLAAKPVHVSLRPADLSLVRYRSTSLDPATVDRIRLSGGLSMNVAHQIAIEARLD